MRLAISIPLLFLVLVSAEDEKDFYSFSAKTMSGDHVDFEQFRGSITLVVNVASECGFTDAHYKALPKLQEAMQHHKFQILAFPCNQFGSQEPGTNFDILQTVTSKYFVNFNLMEKIDTLGEDAHPAFKYLGETSEEPTWNFWKYLIGADGKPIQAWGPQYSVDAIFDDVWRAVAKNEPGAEPKSTLDGKGFAPNDEL